MPGPLVSVRSALGLLTRLPVGAGADDPGAAAFPVVGAAVGLLGALPLVFLGVAGEPVLGAIASVATLAVVSGGLHLDGLADTTDAMLAPSPAAAEHARKEPAVGPGGATAIVLVLGTQVAALASVIGSSGPMVAGALVVVGGSASRWLPVLAVVLLRRRVAPHGLGAWFSAHVSIGDAAIGAVSVALTVAVAGALVGWAIVPGTIIGIAAGIVGAALIAGARGRLDGDGLGASVEIALTATLAGLAVVAR
jgi:adenosylcobinamide-GDP ribazoletransferase